MKTEREIKKDPEKNPILKGQISQLEWDGEYCQYTIKDSQTVKKHFQEIIWGDLAYGTWKYLEKKFPKTMKGIIPFDEIKFIGTVPCKDIVGVKLIGNFWHVMCHYDYTWNERTGQKSPERIASFMTVKKVGENEFSFHKERVFADNA